MEINTINKCRSMVALAAETIDYFRLIPRIMLAGYAYLLWKVVHWYMAIPEPTTQHAALVTTVVGASAAIIGLYQKSGHEWGKNPLIMWRRDFYGDENKKPNFISNDD